MILRRSRFVHQLPVGKDRTLIVHAISHMRLPADGDINTLIDYFAEPRRIPPLIRRHCFSFQSRRPWRGEARLCGVFRACPIAGFGEASQWLFLARNGPERDGCGKTRIRIRSAIFPFHKPGWRAYRQV